jgi:hypothetical protein
VVGSVIVRGKGEGDVGGQLRVDDGRGERRADWRASCEWCGMSRCRFRMVRLFCRGSGQCVCLKRKGKRRAETLGLCKERECYELGLRSGGTAASLLTELPLHGGKLHSIGD